jgi:hypothetical protein
MRRSSCSTASINLRSSGSNRAIRWPRTAHLPADAVTCHADIPRPRANTAGPRRGHPGLVAADVRPNGSVDLPQPRRSAELGPTPVKVPMFDPSTGRSANQRRSGFVCGGRVDGPLGLRRRAKQRDLRSERSRGGRPAASEAGDRSGVGASTGLVEDAEVGHPTMSEADRAAAGPLRRKGGLPPRPRWPGRGAGRTIPAPRRTAERTKGVPRRRHSTRSRRGNRR